MSEHTVKTNTNAKPTPQAGKVDIHAAREGLAMVMDALRVMEAAGVKLSKATVLYDGKICLLPTIEILGHKIGIGIIKVMEGGKDVEKQVFTTDGVSVMDKFPVMDSHGQERK